MSQCALRCYNPEDPSKTRGYLLFIDEKSLENFLGYAQSSSLAKFRGPDSTIDAYEKKGPVQLDAFLQSQVNSKKCFFVGQLPASAFIENAAE